MDGLLNLVRQTSRFLNGIAGVSITFIMLLTVCDVILRAFNVPIVGAYELVAFTGALVIGFAVPLTSWLRAHIFVDFFILKFSQKVQGGFHVVTRCVGIILFFLIAWNLIKVGMDLQASGEVSPTLQLPFYYVAFAVAVACFVECLVLLCDIVKIFGGKYE
jgi:TRAP-type C4-dicarboxylate transport system permease small subunit